MVGMNLSSSVPEKKTKVGKTSDHYFAFIAGILFLSVVVFGGLRWYIKVLDNRLSNFDEILANNAEMLRGENVDRIAHFDQRLTLAEKQLRGRVVDSQSLLDQLENLVIPAVRLTQYNYNETGKFVEVGGVADNFKSIAQQIISFKSEDLFSGIKVESLVVTDDGEVKFSFKAVFN